MVINALPKSYEYYVESILSQQFMHTLDELTAKLLHEETRKELHGKKQKDIKALWVQFCKMSTKKKRLHGGDKCNESKTITLIRRLSRPIIDVANLAIGQRIMQCHMKEFSKFEPNKSTWWKMRVMVIQTIMT
jgi:hypothetical protein